MHKSIEESGLGKVFDINPVTDSSELAKFIGKRVRYKKDCVTPADGRIAEKGVFVIKETQLNYQGKEVLRGYAEDIFIGERDYQQPDEFGRPIDPEVVEIIE